MRRLGEMKGHLEVLVLVTAYCFRDACFVRDTLPLASQVRHSALGMTLPPLNLLDCLLLLKRLVQTAKSHCFEIALNSQKMIHRRGSVGRKTVWDFQLTNFTWVEIRVPSETIDSFMA
jgi:hypothetical protein